MARPLKQIPEQDRPREILAHNHPAGELEPSGADLDATRQIRQAGEILGIELLDHIIFNRNGYFSFLESGRL